MADRTDARAVVGFTLRDGSRRSADSIWSRDRRREFLLVEETLLPISADARVLLDVLGAEPHRGNDGEWLVNPANLVPSHDHFNRLLESRPNRSHDVLRLAITAPRAYLAALSDQRGFPDDAGRAQPEQELLAAGWSLLGFDSLNFNGAISALFGCSFLDKARAARAFASHLNRFGLFREPLAAARFSSARNEEIRAHAGFTVAGVLLRGPLPHWCDRPEPVRSRRRPRGRPAGQPHK